MIPDIVDARQPQEAVELAKFGTINIPMNIVGLLKTTLNLVLNKTFVETQMGKIQFGAIRQMKTNDGSSVTRLKMVVFQTN